MNYLTIFLIGIIFGWIISVFLSFYFSKKTIVVKKEDLVITPEVTKEDILKITTILEELKNLYKNNTKDEEDEDEKILEAENEFYESIAGDDE